MIYYNNENNAYCRTVNVQKFETIEHNTMRISTLLYTRNPYSYSHFEIFICIYSVRGENSQISTNTPRYTTCCAANVFVKVALVSLSVCLSVCLSVDNITQKVMNGLG